MSNKKQNVALLVRRALGRMRARKAAGFTLTEMLATMLIMVMVTTMVATGIPAAQKAYLKTVNAANAQMALSTTLSAMRNELGMAKDVRVNGNDIYYLADEGWWESITNNSKKTDMVSSLEKWYYQGTTFETLTLDTSGGKSNSDGITGAYDLVPDKSITNELRVEFENPSYDKDTKVITVGKVVVKDKLNQELAQVSDYKIRTRG